MISRRSRGERGASAVEFALVALPLMTMVFGALEFGLAIQARTLAGNAAREGVRIASLGGTEAEVRAAALGGLSPVTGTKTVTVRCTKAGGGACRLGDPASTGGTAEVSVRVEYRGVTGMFPALTDAVLERSSTMRIE